jgi:hypothetical protein
MLGAIAVIDEDSSRTLRMVFVGCNALKERSDHDEDERPEAWSRPAPQSGRSDAAIARCDAGSICAGDVAGEPRRAADDISD